MERKDRITEVINYLGIAYTAFALKCGINPSNLKKMLEGEQTITDKTLHRIVATYPEFNINWLKTEDGEMIVHPNTSQCGNGNVHQEGHAGRDLSQTNNSEKILSDFIEGLKSQNTVTLEVATQAKMAMSQNSDLIAQMGKSLDEISEHRKLVDRLITIIENKNS